MTSDQQQQTNGSLVTYPYSVKIEQTAYGARISVHAYAHSEKDAIDRAIKMYQYTKLDLIELGFKIAPEEPAAKK